MGTDATIVIERKYDGRWETIGTIAIPRNYELFQRLQDKGIPGYPPDVEESTRTILEALEDWGELYMSYEQFRNILKKCHWSDYDVIKKKWHSECRVIVRFDN